MESTTKDKLTGTVPLLWSGFAHAESSAKHNGPKIGENRILASVCTIISPSLSFFEKTIDHGSRIVKLTVVLLSAAPETTAGGVTGVTGNGQSGNM